MVGAVMHELQSLDVAVDQKDESGGSNESKCTFAHCTARDANAIKSSLWSRGEGRGDSSS